MSPVKLSAQWLLIVTLLFIPLQVGSAEDRYTAPRVLVLSEDFERFREQERARDEVLYGVESSKPYSNGFVVVDGRYLDAPYVVSRRGLCVFINEVLVSPSPPFRFPPKASIPVSPPSSAELERDGVYDFTDSRLNQYLYDYWLYIVGSHEPDPMERLRQVILQIPGVFTVVPRDDGFEKIELVDGRVIIGLFFSFETTYETVENKLKGSRLELKELTERIQLDGVTTFIHPMGGQILLPRVEMLIDVVERIKRERATGSVDVEIDRILPMEQVTTHLREFFVMTSQLQERLFGSLRANSSRQLSNPKHEARSSTEGAEAPVNHLIWVSLLATVVVTAVVLYRRSK